VTLRRLTLAAAVLLGCLSVIFVAAMGASAGMPDWSGQWENVGGTPDASGGFNQSLDQVLKTMQWGPPNRPELQARVDKMVASERKRLEAISRGEDPGGVDVRACTFGYPLLMLDSPLMFEVLPTPKETTLIFSSREIRHVYTDGRPHTPKDELWATGKDRLSSLTPSRSNLLLLLRSRRVSRSWHLGTSRANKRSPS